MGNSLGQGILYLTFDGLLQPLGYSQVARLIVRLAGTGHRYRVVSLERRSDVEDLERVARLRAALAGVGIGWTYRVYRESLGPLGAAGNVSGLFMAAVRELMHADIGLVHARGYQAGLIAHLLRSRFGIPYLFDARGAWIDERVSGKSWVASPLLLPGARRLESSLFSQARAVVTLTELHAEAVREGKFGPYRGAPIVAIPTCADYSDFELPDRDGERESPASFCIAIIGSMNASYLVDRSLALAQRTLQAHSGAGLLILTKQVEQYEAAIRATRIPKARYEIRSVAHDEMPGALRSVDWGIQLLTGGPAKLGSVPTKMAEFFAAGVGVVHHGCNEEVSRWVEQSGAGIVLHEVDDESLDRVALRLGKRNSREVLLHAREVTAPHFSLDAGARRYSDLLRRLSV